MRVVIRGLGVILFSGTNGGNGGDWVMAGNLFYAHKQRSWPTFTETSLSESDVDTADIKKAEQYIVYILIQLHIAVISARF